MFLEAINSCFCHNSKLHELLSIMSMKSIFRVAFLVLASVSPHFGFVVKPRGVPLLSTKPTPTRLFYDSSDIIDISKTINAAGTLYQAYDGKFAGEGYPASYGEMILGKGIDEYTMVRTTQPVDNSTIAAAVGRVHSKATSLKDEYIAELETENAFMAAAGVAQTLAACASWFPPAAACFEVTSAVSFAGAATAAAVALARQNTVFTYINSMALKISEEAEIKPLKAFSDLVMNMTGSCNNVGAAPGYARSAMQASQMLIIKDKGTRNVTTLSKYLYCLGAASVENVPMDERLAIMETIAELKDATDPQTIAKLQETLHKKMSAIWPGALEVTGEFIGSLVMTTLAVKDFKTWGAARARVAAANNDLTLDEKGDIVEGATVEEEESFMSRYSVRVEGWELFTRACQGLAGAVATGFSIYSFYQAKAMGKEMGDNLDKLAHHCEDYYESLSASLIAEKKAENGGAENGAENDGGP
uniref:Uncharacterized protein n=1 Tax=Ditylum brightwellii TaxID=49249 RepID=A0A7S1ZBE0_9STRA|mmetsp:Transcript_2821/g.4325  ORF Transcript_2821/g.4325 Transcript_2821/m.4325 type:complete len:474 (+) Transcript_2821:86-1507(+)